MSASEKRTAVRLAERLAIFDLVGALMDKRDRLEKTEHSPEGREAALALLKDAIDLVAALVGPIGRAYGAAVSKKDDGRLGELTALQERLELIRPLLTAGLPEVDHHPSSIGAAINEIHAIRMGDAPVLFDKLGRKVAHRKRVGQHRALILEAMGEGLGLSAAERRNFIATAFAKQWDQIRKDWPEQPVLATPSDPAPDLAQALLEAKEQGRDMSVADWQRLVFDAAAMLRGGV